MWIRHPPVPEPQLNPELTPDQHQTLETVYKNLTQTMSHHEAITYMMHFTATPEEMHQLLVFAHRSQLVEPGVYRMP